MKFCQKIYNHDSRDYKWKLDHSLAVHSALNQTFVTNISILIMKSILVTFSSIMMIQGNPAAYNLMRMPKQMMPTKTIAELVVETPCFGTLLAAVQAADLVETLSGEGPFTVFAPNNAAFAKIPTETLDGLLADKEALTGVLLRHVVPGAALKALEVPEGTNSLTTAGGEDIEVTRDRYITIKSSAGEAGVIAFDIVASNGVIHMVNSVF